MKEVDVDLIIESSGQIIAIGIETFILYWCGAIIYFAVSVEIIASKCSKVKIIF